MIRVAFWQTWRPCMASVILDLLTKLLHSYCFCSFNLSVAKTNTKHLIEYQFLGTPARLLEINWLYWITHLPSLKGQMSHPYQKSLYSEYVFGLLTHECRFWDYLMGYRMLYLQTGYPALHHFELWWRRYNKTKGARLQDSLLIHIVCYPKAVVLI